MDTLRDRALKALGLEAQMTPAGLCYIKDREVMGPVSEAELIGLLLLELDRLTTGNFVYYGPRWFGVYPIKEHRVEVGTIIGNFSGTCLEALVLAVEAAKEVSDVRPE